MRNEENELGIWLKTFLIFLSAFVSGVAFFIYINRYIVFNRAAAANAALIFTPATAVAKQGYEFAAQLMLSTDKANVRGTDVKIIFDTTKLELVTILPLSTTNSNLQTNLPVDSEGRFYEDKIVGQANRSGVIEFSAVTANLAQKKVFAPFNGTAMLANLTFRAKKAGKTALSIVHTHPTHDSTVVDDSMPPHNILSRTNMLQITIED